MSRFVKVSNRRRIGWAALCAGSARIVLTTVMLVAAGSVPLVVATASPSSAATACGVATKTWTGGADTGNWDDAANWSPAGAPSASDVVCVPSSAAVTEVDLDSTDSVQALEADRPLNISGSLTVTSTSVNTAISSGTLTGTLDGVGATSIAGSFTWGPDGQINGSGTTTFEPGTTVTLSGDDVSCGGTDCTTYRNIGGPLVNQGTIVVPDGQENRDIDVDNCSMTGSLDNRGTIELNDNVYLYDNCGGGDIDNSTGTITKASGTGTSSIEVPLDNDGTVSVGAGELDFDGGTSGSQSSTGTFRADSPGTLVIGGDNSWNGTRLGGTGSLEVAGTITATGPVSISGATDLTGTLDGVGATSIAGSFTWGPDGQINGSGTTTFEPGTTVTLSGDDVSCGGTDCTTYRNIGGPLVNQGTIVVPDGQENRDIDVDNCSMTGSLDNRGTIELNDNVYLYDNCGGGDIDNSTGTITKASGTGTSSIEVPLDNDGTVSVGAGELDFDGGTSGSQSSTGTFHADSPGTLVIGGDNSWNGTRLGGTGSLEVAGTITATGPVSISGATDVTGTLDGVGATSIAGSFTWGPDGQINGSGTTTFEPGTTVTLSGDDVSCGGTDCTTYRNIGGPLVNQGTIVVPDGQENRDIDVDNCSMTGSLDNRGTIELNDNVYLYDNCGGGDIDNSTGTITKASGTGTSSIEVPLDNDGTVSVGAGDGGHGTLELTQVNGYDSGSQTLSGGTFAAVHGGILDLDNVGAVQTANAVIDLDGAGSSVENSDAQPVLGNLTTIGTQGGVTLRNGQTLATPGPLQSAGTVQIGPSSSLTTTGSYTQSSGSTELQDPTADLTATGGEVIMSSGSFSGSGSVTPRLEVDGGTVTPGNSPGTLAVSGPASLSSTTSVAAQIDGTGTAHYDRLVATGAATVGGTLTLNRGPDYTPTDGDTFAIVSGSSRSGTFANVNQNLSFAGWYFTPTNTSTTAGVTIHRIAGADVIGTASAQGGSFDVPSPGTWTLNVENAGGSSTSGAVTVVATLGAGQSLQSAHGSGWSCSGTNTVTCSTSAVAASGTALPPISVVVGLTTAAQPSTTLSLQVAGGSDAYSGDNSFSTSVPVENVPPPHASLGISSTRGTAGFSVDFDATGSTGANSYVWNFGDGSTSSASQPSHTYFSPGVYTVTLRVDNQFFSDTASTQVTVLADVPLAANAGDDQTVTPNQTVHFDGSSSQPVGGIDSYSWAFTGAGGPSSASGPTASNHWSTPGDYPVTLTVTHGSQSDSTTVTVHVVAPAGSGLAVTITDGTNPIAGATAMVLDAQGDKFPATSNSSGLATVTGLADGPYSLYVFASGYEPQVVQAVVTNGTGAINVALTSGAVGATSLSSQRLDYSQIVAAGIDPSDPANQNVLNFQICLAFGDASCVSFSGDANSDGEIFAGGFGGGGGGGTCNSTQCTYPIPTAAGGGEAIGSIDMVEGQPTAVILIIPGEAKWLKEFFSVKMLVVNLAPAGFSFTDGAASLDIPEGLSLAPTATPQTSTIQLPDVPGGGTAEADWIVRGDTEGYYNLHAHYGATLNPVGASVDLDAQTQTPLHVWGLSAVDVHVTADDSAVAHEPYRIHVDMTNVTSGPDATPIYNPVLELEQSAQNNLFIFEPAERFDQGTDVLQPGQTFGADYVIVPTFTGLLNPVGSVTFLDTGLPAPVVDPVTPEPRIAASNLTATPTGKNLTLSWDPITGATAYAIYTTPSDTTPFNSSSLVAKVSGPNPRTTDSIAMQPGTHWYAISTEDSSGIWTMHHQLVEYVNPAGGPTVTIVTKSSGSAGGGNKVTIKGTNLEGATQVLFGSVPGTSVKASTKGTSVTVIAPAGSPGTVNVTVATPNGTTPVTAADHYTYLGPTVTKVTKSSGPPVGGNKVTIKGTNLEGATQVLFGSVPGTSVKASTKGTSVTVIAPAGSPGTVNVTVVTPIGTTPVTSSGRYTYT